MKDGKRRTNPSGYILFSSEMRAVIKAKHPEYSFGELSRIVGTEWRNLEAVKKAEYEERAAKQAELQERERNTASPRTSTPSNAIMGVVPPPTPMGLLHQLPQAAGGRVMGHSVGGVAHPSGAGSGYPQPPPPPPYPAPQTSQTGQTGSLMAPSVPMFVTVPPRPQRLLHSEAYVRYIESLNKDGRSVSRWQHTFTARREDVPLSREQEARLPVHWLPSKGAHSCMAQALWRLRDIMLRDALNIQQSCPDP
uniref:HMG box domain-containing protein n=1 Tax=Eptatretus burgeri TaxID=7764 RepID=A0A8C4QSZ1_EPTBU